MVFGEFGEWPPAGCLETPPSITGTPLSEPFAVEVRGDGTTVPARIELVPAVAKR